MQKGAALAKGHEPLQKEAALDKGHESILAKGVPCKRMFLAKGWKQPLIKGTNQPLQKVFLAQGSKQSLVKGINQRLQKVFLAKGWKQPLAKGVTLKKDTLAKGFCTKTLRKGFVKARP